MQTIVTARHCEVPDELKERAELQLTKLAKLVRRPLSAEVVFDADHGNRVVELRLTRARGPIKIASAEALDFLTALDGAVAKMRKQLTKGAARPNRRASVD
jgi:ribosomal subunit interface protein